MDDFKVGERVAMRRTLSFSSRSEWSVQQISKITPSGQIRLTDVETRFRQNGKAMGSYHSEIMHLTPEVAETVRLHSARNAVLRETYRLPHILCADKLTVEECERIIDAAKAYRGVLAAINEAHKPTTTEP